MEVLKELPADNESFVVLTSFPEQGNSFREFLIPTLWHFGFRKRLTFGPIIFWQGEKA